MAALSNEVKEYIVTALACFDTPPQVVADVKQRFGVVVSSQQLAAYNPSTVAGSRLSARLKTLFDKTREKFREDTSDIPVSNQAYRLRALNRMFTKVEQQGNIAMAAQLLEQAARESGGTFTNKQRHEHAGPNGGPIEQKTTVVDETAVAAQVAKLQGDY